MPNDDRTKIVYSRTPESAAMLANVKRAMAITATPNHLTFNDSDEIRHFSRYRPEPVIHAGVGPLRADEHSEFALVTATAKICGSLSDADRDSRSASVQ